MRSQTATAKKRGSRLRFFGETINELKKVVWLTRREAIYLTTMVLIVAAAAGIVLGTVDFGFSSLIDKVLLGR